MRKSRAIASLVGALFIAGCAAFPASSPYPSPGSLTPSTTVGSQGSVFFVSASEAWELTQPPDHLHTVVLRTVDGGAHWKIWSIAPEPGSPVAFTTTDVLLANGTDLLRSSDGSNWTVKTMPAFGAPVFLPDLRHGWLGGFPIFVPAAPSPTTVPGKGGGGSTTGKGGPGTPPPGKGGGTSSTPANTCNDKGCQPTELWSTADGGATWRLLMRSTVSVSGGPMYFFSPTVGVIEQNLGILVTGDGGLSWRRQTFSVSGVTVDQPATELAPTMFDARTGVLPIVTSTGAYLSRTADGGLTWSEAQRINDCAGCTGLGLALLDGQHWIDDSQGLNFTADGGQTWRKVSTTNPGKTTSAVEMTGSPPSAVIALAPGLFASETTDFGAQWRAVALPDIYPTYQGFDSQGGCCGP
jgi:photosystem II stability/assembly factor-like uncharacterized protein